jgi:hypothetical protein
MSKTILYVLQQSVYNNDGKWISADSNINMGIGIIKELVKKTDWSIYVLIGKLEDFADIQSYDELLSHPQVHFIPYNFPVDAFLNRQHFSVFDFDKLMKSLPKIDIIWNNIVEVTRNIKTYLFYKKIPAKIISSCYWLDCPEINEPKVDKSISYQWRQFDGFLCSDLVSFTCLSTYQAFLGNSPKVFNSFDMMSILDKHTVWDFGYSSDELNKAKKEKIPFELNKKTVLFLNRLSGINYTHHEEFIEAVNLLSNQRQDFNVIFTNPSQKINWTELKQKVKNLFIWKESPLTRDEYIELLWRGDISVHLYDIERMGGCANTESIYCDNIAIMPGIYEYKRRGGINYPFYLNLPFNATEIAEKINNSLDSNFIGSSAHSKMKYRNRESEYEKVSNKVIEDIDRLENG